MVFVFSGGTVVAGPLLHVEPVFGETQEEQLSGIRWNVVACRVAVILWVAERSSEAPWRSDADDDAASCHSTAARIIYSR